MEHQPIGRRIKRDSANTVLEINAITGEIIWKAPGYRCTHTNVSGGVQSTAALGKNNVSDLIFVSYALTVDTDTRGRLVAYSKGTGEEVWTYDLKITAIPLRFDV